MTEVLVMADAEALRMILEKLGSIEQGQNSLTTRMDALETATPPVVKTEQEMPEAAAVAAGLPREIKIVQSAKEKPLQLTFGDDCSPMALRLFLDHYTLAKDQNMKRGVTDWQDPEFRANELRYQLRGEPALWLSQENSLLNTWVKDDTEIIKKLKERFMGTQSTELNIMAFEEASQAPTESLSQYMTRCQGLGQTAFGEFATEPNSTQQRIVWKFLSGIRDAEVRNAVIREKWMASPSQAKSYEEVLKIAETAKMTRMATSATGKGNGGTVAAAPMMSKVDRKRHGSSRSSTESASSRSSTGSTSSRNSTGSTNSNVTQSQGNFLCHYCNSTSHFGGWKLCPSRLKDDPNWTPNNSSKGKDFQKPPSQ